MTFADLSAGDAIFVDANTFIYHFAPDPALGSPCSELLHRIENQELLGFTSVHLLAEVAHKMMTLEANRTLGWSLTGMANRLRRHPAEVQRLTIHKVCIDKLANSRLQFLTVSMPLLAAAIVVTQQTGLLVNDALVVAQMQQHGLTKLASHDTDFDRVPGLTRYSPA